MSYLWTGSHEIIFIHFRLKTPPTRYFEFDTAKCPFVLAQYIQLFNF